MVHVDGSVTSTTQLSKKLAMTRADQIGRKVKFERFFNDILLVFYALYCPGSRHLSLSLSLDSRILVFHLSVFKFTNLFIYFCYFLSCDIPLCISTH